MFDPRSIGPSHASLFRPADFRWGPVHGHIGIPTPPDPSLGPLASFNGTFVGSGFNTIFRPQNPATRTPLPNPPTGPDDNILELNLTSETLAFSTALGSVPNRGMVQGDIFLNGVPYLQTISDVTISSQPTGIHLEPGVWLSVPTTTDPAEAGTVVRMASIPHGTTIVAQGTSSTINGKPTIPGVDITPFPINNPANRINFPSQIATSNNTERIPQDLSSFISAGTITQAVLDDPNTLLRNHIASQNITSTTIIEISTSPATPLFGGGTDNIAFLLGNPSVTAPNAHAAQVTATFWIETVEHVIHVPPFSPGHPPLVIRPESGGSGQPAPEFHVHPPMPIPSPRPITVHSIQIQYSQLVLLNFNTLSWPHVSVATLVPSGPIPVPPSVWAP